MPKLSHLTFHSFSSRETISIKNIKIMNPMKVCQIDPNWSANKRASSGYQFVNPPKAIAQSSILGGWIHNDDDRFDFLFKLNEVSTDRGFSWTSNTVPTRHPGIKVVRGFLIVNLYLFFLRFFSLSRSLFIFSRISFSQPFIFISGFTFVLPIKFSVKFFEIFQKI